MKRSFIAALALLLCICSVGCEKLPSSITPNETGDTTAYVTEGTQAATEGSTEIDTESTEPPKEPEPPKPEIDFIVASSYKGTESTGVVTVKKDIEGDVSGKNVIIIEDIVDTGNTYEYIHQELMNAKIKTAAMPGSSRGTMTFHRAFQ